MPAACNPVIAVSKINVSGCNLSDPEFLHGSKRQTGCPCRLSPACQDWNAADDVSAWTVMISTPGCRARKMVTAAAASLPPPMGTIMTSMSGRSSTISRYSVPTPLISRGSELGPSGLKHNPDLLPLPETFLMFYGITDLTTFILGTIFIVLLPGPNSLYVMSVASRWGMGAGYRGACGIFVGDTILMILSATGVASLLQATPALFLVLKYAGAAYLSWLGLALLRAAWRTWRGHALPGTSSAPADPTHPFKTALLISLMNPKAILFFISFFIQFVAPDYPHPALSFLILGIIVQICSALYLSILIFGGAHLAQQLRRRQRLSAAATGGVGGLFIGFGVKLAGASLG